MSYEQKQLEDSFDDERKAGMLDRKFFFRGGVAPSDDVFREVNALDRARKHGDCKKFDDWGDAQPIKGR